MGEIDIFDLLRSEFPVYIELKSKTRKQIFDDAIQLFGSQKLLANKLNKYSVWKENTRQDVGRMRLGNIKIKLDVLNGLLNILNIDISEIRDDIIFVSGRCKTKLNAKIFPLKTSPNISFLIGKTMGDGGIGSNEHFHYCNSSDILLNDVQNKISKIFKGKIKISKYPSKDGTTNFNFPRIIGTILWLFGAPKGNKTNQSYRVPKWIMNGDKEAKKAFLKALFDDECCVEKRKISIELSKSKDLEQNLTEFLKDLIKLFRDFSMISGQIIERKKAYTTKNQEKRIKKRIQISGVYNLRIFISEIGLSHKEKKLRLERVIKNYPQKINRYPKTYSKDKIYQILKHKPYTAMELSKMSNLSYRYIYNILNELKSETIIHINHKKNGANLFEICEKGGSIRNG